MRPPKRLFGSYAAGEIALSFDAFDADIAAFVIVVTAILFAGQVAYAFSSKSVTALQRAGAFLALMGGVIVGLPYLSERSIQVEAGRRLPPLRGSFVMSTDAARYNEKREEQRPSAIQSVRIERRYAFAMAVLGGVLNTFGDVFIRPN